MKLFTEELAEPNKYEITATINVSIIVTAHNEGDAGYIADKELESINGYILHNINNIKKINE